MMSIMRQMRGALSLNDLLLIIITAIFIPLPLAFPLTARVVSRRMNQPYRLVTMTDDHRESRYHEACRDAGNGSAPTDANSVVG